jgi:hypothetical protein
MIVAALDRPLAEVPPYMLATTHLGRKHHVFKALM